MENMKPIQQEKPCQSNLMLINVGGIRFETKLETLQKIPNSKLANLCPQSEYYLSERGEYFFDRDPQVFASILNYHRIGEMHLPRDFCSMTVQHELKYWGVNEDSLEQCCWLRYQEQIEKQKTLEKLDRATIVIHTAEAWDKTRGCCPCWRKWRPRIWSFLDDPQSSKWAKGFACLSALVIMVSLFTLCAESHPDFRQNLTAEHYADIHDVSVDYILESWEYYGYGEYDYESGTEGNDTTQDNATTNYDDIYYDEPQPTEKPRPKKYGLENNLSTPIPCLEIIDLVCHTFFVLEFLTRFLFCPSKRRFFMNVFNIIDLVSTLPFFIDLLVNAAIPREKYQQSTLDIILILRVIRVTRIFRLVRHHRGLQILTFTLQASIREIILMLVFLTIGMVVFSCLVYYADMETFKSIPHAFWWSIVTMTTVGYGDIVPHTNWGYFVGALCTISGVLVIAFTVPVIVSNFLLFYQYVELSAQKKEQTARQQAERAKSKIAVCPVDTVEVTSAKDMKSGVGQAF